MRKMLIFPLLAALLLSGTALAESANVPAGGQSASGPNTTGLSAWGVLGWGGGLGLGGRYMMPLTSKGVLNHPTIQDRFAFEFGADMFHYSYDFGAFGDYSFNEVLPVAGVAWTFWLDDKLAFYPKIDIGYGFGWVTGWDDSWGRTAVHGGFFWQGSVGAIYKLSGLSLRGEIGNGLLKAGVGFGF